MCPTATAAWFTLRGPPSKCTAHRSIPPCKPGGLQGPQCHSHMLPRPLQRQLPLQHRHDGKITRSILKVFPSSLNACYKGYLNVSSFTCLPTGNVLLGRGHGTGLRGASRDALAHKTPRGGCTGSPSQAPSAWPCTHHVHVTAICLHE